jgi:G patch domain-containing protein 1
LPERPEGTREDDYVKEMTEFANCAKIFKPMTGFMASRFTTGKSSTVIAGSDGSTGDKELVSKPEPKVKDAVEEAARMGMFGKMTRSTQTFYPTRLLCKRFNVKPPAHSRADDETGARPDEANKEHSTRGFSSSHQAQAQAQQQQPEEDETRMLPSPAPPSVENKAGPAIDPGKNEAVEGTTAHAEVLRAIFGDSDSE